MRNEPVLMPSALRSVLPMKVTTVKMMKTAIEEICAVRLRSRLVKLRVSSRNTAVHQRVHQYDER